jgi:spectinomycin phosphotransferase
MREPPQIADDRIIGALEASFGLRVATLEFLPLGNDSASWSFRVQAAQGPSYFLKVRAVTRPMPADVRPTPPARPEPAALRSSPAVSIGSGDGDGVAPGPVPGGVVSLGGGTGPDPAVGAAVPSYLHGQGMPNVLAPVTTNAGAPYVLVDRFALALYPLLEASPGVQVGLSPGQGRLFGASVRRVHDVALTPQLTSLVGREAFRPRRRELVPHLQALLASADQRDPVTRELAEVWRAREDIIHTLVEQADELGRELASERFSPVLCHADLHTWNVLVDADQQLWIVDWDEAILAPKERDLMFVIGGIDRRLVRPRDTEHFLQGYGEATIDQRLLAYYRIAWAVQDIAAFGEEALMMPKLGEESRRDAVSGFAGLFDPGGIVDLASASGIIDPTPA